MNTTRIKDLFASRKAITFKPELAVIVGINGAIILHQIEHWINVFQSRPQKYGDHFIDGHWWVYNTYEQWKTGNFPWMDKRTIMRAFNDLRDKGLILTREHENFKKGIWVTINYDKLGELIADFYAGQNDPDNDDGGQNVTDNIGYGGQNVTEIAVPEIPSIQRLILSAESDTFPKFQPVVQDLMKQRDKQLEAPKAVTKVKPKARDISGTELVQAVLRAFNVKQFCFSARLADRLGKPLTVQVDDAKIKYYAPVDLYDNDPAFKVFIKERIRQLKDIPGITIDAAFKNLVNFDAKPSAERPNRLPGYHHWKKMNPRLIAELKPKEVVTVIVPEAYDDTLI